MYGDYDPDDANSVEHDDLVDAMREALQKKGYAIVTIRELDHLREMAGYHERVCDVRRGDALARQRVKDEHQRIHAIKKQAADTTDALRKLVATISAEEDRVAKHLTDVCGLIDAKAKRQLAKKLGFAVSTESQPSRLQVATCRRKYNIEPEADLVGALHQLGIITDDEHSYLVQNTTVPAADFAYRGRPV